MRASIVIRSYNEAEHIGKLLVGISMQDTPAHEVIVVDSGSTDGTPDIAASLGAQVISIDKREFSFGRALNIGCRAATGDILVFVSAHVYPTKTTWLGHLLSPFADERVKVSYGKQRGNSVNKFSEHQIFEKWFPTESVCPQKNYFCNNANCAVRRSDWEKRPYDELLTGLEDLAWAKQVQNEGGWIAYQAAAEIIHVHDETWASVFNRYRREAMAIRTIVDDARFTRRDMIGLFLWNTVTDARRAIQLGKLRQEFTSIIAFRWNQFTGTYKGYNGAEEMTSALRNRFYFPTLPADQTATSDDISALIDYSDIDTQIAQTAVMHSDLAKTNLPN